MAEVEVAMSALMAEPWDRPVVARDGALGGRSNRQGHPHLRLVAVDGRRLPEADRVVSSPSVASERAGRRSTAESSTLSRGEEATIALRRRARPVESASAVAVLPLSSWWVDCRDALALLVVGSVGVASMLATGWAFFSVSNAPLY
ncbi:MAG: hypothetical protein LBM23_01610 [Propionibacteriaceae bacterium]|jgi:hypothetical protein|nr:hypothetical protein [Propionibacteriaceae bacterium]